MSQPPSPSEISTRVHGHDLKVSDEIVVIVLSGSQRGQRVRLAERLRVGKAPDNDLTLNDDTVSTIRHTSGNSRITSQISSIGDITPVEVSL